MFSEGEECAPYSWSHLENRSVVLWLRIRGILGEGQQMRSTDEQESNEKGFAPPA